MYIDPLKSGTWEWALAWDTMVMHPFIVLGTTLIVIKYTKLMYVLHCTYMYMVGKLDGPP